MGLYSETMFNGWTYHPVKLYWCTLNQQIVERHPTYIRLNDLGVGGYEYKNIRPSMTYTGDLD